MTKIFDCITFFQENFISNIRFEILNSVVDYFVVCESIYDHRGRKKKLNFKLKNLKYKNKIIYIVMREPFESKNNLWKNQAQQREYLFKGLEKATSKDLIMFSDPDEIPRPEILKNFFLKKKYAIFLQNCYCYKFNLFNKYESPWEGTRICKKKDLKSFDYLRQKILKKNISKSFWKFHIEKDIELINNGGWHFNSLMSANEISIKLKTFAHDEFSSNEYSDVNIIKKNILEMKDLFKRGRIYDRVILDHSFPNYLQKNKIFLKKWIV